MGIGDWGLGIGDWGLGIGDWAQSPIPKLIINKYRKFMILYINILKRKREIFIINLLVKKINIIKTFHIINILNYYLY